MSRNAVVGLALIVAGCGSSGGGGQASGGAGAGGSAVGGGASGGSGGAGASGGVGMSGMANAGGSAGSQAPGCTPVRITPDEVPGAVLLTGDPKNIIKKAKNLALSGDNLFYVDERGIERIAKTGGTPELVFADTTQPRIRLSPSAIYRIHGAGLESVALDAKAGTATVVAADIGATEASDWLLRVDATNAYFWKQATQEIERVELASGMGSTLAMGASYDGWFFNGDSLYYDAYNGIYRVPATGGAATLVSQQEEIVESVAVDATRIFFGGFEDLSLVGTPDNTVLVHPRGDFVERIEIEGNRVLYSTRDSRLGWVSTDASTCTELAAPNDRDDWTYDDKNIFLAVNGALYSVPQ